MAYEYTRLDASRNEIRLLTVSPGRFDDPLRCHVETRSLSADAEAPDFEALSYHWGDPAPVCPVELAGGRAIQIARNLDVALRHLRHATSTRVLWIDALCINQQDVDERSSQILAMDTIFSRARRVVVWLGPGDQASDVAMEALSRESPSAIADINAILSRPWWRRLWVVQEFVLAASEPLIVCGHKTLAWKCVRTAANAIIVRRRGDDPDALMANIMFPLLLDGLRTDLHTRKVWITAVMLHLLDFQAADPRDKVYACLGLLRPELRAALAPDYSKSIQEVFTDVSRYILTQEDLTFFSAFYFERPGTAGLGDASDRDDNNSSSSSSSSSSVTKPVTTPWPSWVPDFGRLVMRTPRNPLSFANSHDWRPIGPRKPSTAREESIAEESPVTGSASVTISQRLVAGVAGHFFDTIDAVAPLQGGADLLRQVVGPLYDMACAAAGRPLPEGHVFSTLTRDTDVEVMLVGGEKPEWRTVPGNCKDIFRSEAQKYGVVLPERYTETGAEEKEVIMFKCPDRRWEYAQGRYFFTTALGFSGICTAPAEVGDVVTVLYGERVPIVLRPQPRFSMASSPGPLYTAVGGAHVGAIQCDNQITELCATKQLEEVVFDLI